MIIEDSIPSSLRYTYWPTTFSNKSGFQSSWRNTGRAPVVRDEEGTARYPIVFRTVQLHGQEGVHKSLKTTVTAPNLRPHNKHSYTCGEPVGNDTPTPAPSASSAALATSFSAPQALTVSQTQRKTQAAIRRMMTTMRRRRRADGRKA